MGGATNAPDRLATSSRTWRGWIMSAPRGRWRPCSSRAPIGRMTTGSSREIEANSSDVMSERRTRGNRRAGHKPFEPPDANATLNKVNTCAPNPFRAAGLPPIRADRGPFLRRKRLDLRRVRRRPAGLGAHASPLRDSRGPRFDALPRAEPFHDGAPRAGDAPSPPDGGGQGR